MPLRSTPRPHPTYSSLLVLPERRGAGVAGVGGDGEQAGAGGGRERLPRPAPPRRARRRVWGHRRRRRRGLHPPPRGHAAGAARHAPQRQFLPRRPPLRRPSDSLEHCARRPRRS
uniref:Uncharacterized protein n=1 Tax=Triticum urartu TaxID=4572 RepID=A0A8R7TI04_TRIUA